MELAVEVHCPLVAVCLDPLRFDNKQSPTHCNNVSNVKSSRQYLCLFVYCALTMLML